MKINMHVSFDKSLRLCDGTDSAVGCSYCRVTQHFTPKTEKVS